MPALTMCWEQHCECLTNKYDRIVCNVTDREPEMRVDCPLSRGVQ